MRAIIERTAIATIRALLVLYPRDFRREFGAEIVAAFSTATRHRRSTTSVLRFTALAIADAIVSGFAEHVDRLRAPRRAATAVSGNQMIQNVTQDLRYALRSLARRPLFAAAVISTLALGIGANTAVFTLVDAVLLRPIPVERPENVVSVYEAMTPTNLYGGVAFPSFEAIRTRATTLAGVAGHSSHQISVQTPAGRDQLNAAVVSGNYFSLLGVRPAIGRLLIPDDDRGPSGAPVVVLSHSAWQRLFNGDTAIAGKTMRIGNAPFTIVGVVEEGFAGTDLADVAEVWAPITMVTTLGIGGLYAPRMAGEIFTTPHFPWVGLIARVRDGVDHRAVTAELNQLANQLDAALPAAERREASLKNPMSLMPITQSAAMRDREALMRFIRLMLVVVVITLLLACANVANLLLARGTERAHELGVRAALGAARVRLAAQLFMEAMLLALGGAVAGLLVAVAVIKLLTAYSLPGSIALARLDLAPDGRVLAFTTAIAVVTALLFGLLPAITASRPRLTSFLRLDRGASGRTGVRNALISAQVAMALVLLVGAALFGRSLRAGLTTDVGFDPSRLAAVSIDLRIHGYDKPRQDAFARAVIERVGKRPGITAVAVASHVPLSRLQRMPFESPDVPGKKANYAMNSVSPAFFGMMGLRPTIGRLFDASESAGKGNSIVVNSAAARAMWGADNVLGKRLTLFGSAPYTVIGVVPTTKYASVRDTDVPMIYFPIAHHNVFPVVNVVAKGPTAAAALTAVREEVAAVDASLSIRSPRLVDEQIAAVLMPQRFGATLLSVFAGIAMLIAAVGVYSVVAYAVSERRREIGIRIALGAQAAHIYWTVLRASLTAVAVGTVIGCAGAAMGAPALAKLLYGISPRDVVAFLSAAAILTVAAVVATLIPAHRASRTDPAGSMRVG